MPEKVGFWKKVEKSKKLQVLFCCMSMAVLIGGYVILLNCTQELNYVKRIREREVSISSATIAEVENVLIQNETLELSGWLYQINAKTSDKCIVLRRTDKSKEILLDTLAVPNSGSEICASINLDELDQEDCYEILMYLQYSEQEESDEGVLTSKEYQRKVSTGQYLYDGVVYNYNPLEYLEPSLDNEQISSVVKNGELIAYSKEGVWIYEYKASLYWIVRFEVFGEIESSPEIPLFVYRVVEGEKGIEVKKEYQGVYITAEDYAKFIKEDYYVYSMPLVDKNSIVYLSTGIYKNRGEHSGWRWNKSYVINPDLIKPEEKGEK